MLTELSNHPDTTGFQVWYCNPVELSCIVETLNEAQAIMQRSDYCMFVSLAGKVQCSTSRDNPHMKVSNHPVPATLGSCFGVVEILPDRVLIWERLYKAISTDGSVLTYHAWYKE